MSELIEALRAVDEATAALNKERAMKPIQRFTPYTLQREWGTETIVAETAAYLGKVLQYKMGKAGGLQSHEYKDETFYLHSGFAWVEHDDGNGKLVKVKMSPGESFHIPVGAPHRFYAITDCLVFESSLPIHNDRVRLEEHYGVETIGDGPGLPTTREMPS
jgi:mannose-6-phosphate isomerase-like protein (cupin superfamily)